MNERYQNIITTTKEVRFHERKRLIEKFMAKGHTRKVAVKLAKAGAK